MRPFDGKVLVYGVGKGQRTAPMKMYIILPTLAMAIKE